MIAQKSNLQQQASSKHISRKHSPLNTHLSNKVHMQTMDNSGLKGSSANAMSSYLKVKHHSLSNAPNYEYP